MLYFIGLGLGNEKDITINGLEAVKKSKKVFLESYTSILGVDIDALERIFECKLILADRNMVESESDIILNASKTEDVSFLVVGDPFGATTHTDLYLRAKKDKIEVKVIHNASIINAVGCCGLQLYKYGSIISVPFFTETWKPDSYYKSILKNRENGHHTLCLLDIKVKEPDFKAMVKGLTKFEPPRYMTVNQCLEQLLHCESVYNKGILTSDTFAVGLARVGQMDQTIIYGKIKDLIKCDFGNPLHCVVIPGDCDEIELEFLDLFKI